MLITRRQFLKTASKGLALSVGGASYINGFISGCAGQSNFLSTSLRDKVYAPMQGKKVNPPSNGCYFGIGRVGWGMQNQIEVSDLRKSISQSIESYTIKLNFKPSIVAYQGGFNAWSRQLKIAEVFALEGILSVIQFAIADTATFVDGSNEQTLGDFAQGIISYGEKYGGLFITPMYEMNLPKPLCNVGACVEREGFLVAYKYLWDIFEAKGANNYVTYTPEFHEYGSKSGWWPEDHRVDWFGLSAYYREGIHDRMVELAELVNPWIGEAREKPFMIQEFAATRTSKEGTGQSRWLQRAMHYIKDVGIRAAIFWDSVNYYRNDDHTLSDASYRILREVLKDPYFISAKKSHL